MTRHAVKTIQTLMLQTPDNCRTSKVFRPLLLTAMTVGLQGCVAMALPVVAGGAIATSEAGRDAVRSDEDKGEANADPVETPTDAPETVQEPVPTPEQSEDKTSPPADALPSEATPEYTEPAELPAGPDTTSVRQSITKDHSPFHAIAAYALAEIGKSEDITPMSAILANPSDLDGRRRPCGPSNASEPAILIDLDQGEATFDPNAVAETYDGDAHGHLSRMREAGVTIGWISALTAENAGAMRNALRSSGLDVRGKDALVLFRYPNDRKQTRRLEFAERHCVLAIAGSERQDFDELYQYLVRQDGAFALERLIGDGWFLLDEGSPAKAEQ